MEKDSTRTVDFTIDEPIICPPDLQTECAVVITLDNHDPDKIALDNCIIKWTADEWFQTRTLRSMSLLDPEWLTHLELSLHSS